MTLPVVRVKKVKPSAFLFRFPNNPTKSTVCTLEYENNS
jgi:hypothetical protein